MMSAILVISAWRFSQSHLARVIGSGAMTGKSCLRRCIGLIWIHMLELV
jgi:hypothetical protein